MGYVTIANTSDLAIGDKKLISVENKKILLANIGGTYYAINNKCPHMGGSLYEGILSEGQIKCPWHGTVFDLQTGKVVQNGKLLFINFNVKDATSYEVKIEGTDIMVLLP